MRGCRAKCQASRDPRRIGAPRGGTTAAPHAAIWATGIGIVIIWKSVAAVKPTQQRTRPTNPFM
jgi:hypothetical protein